MADPVSLKGDDNMSWSEFSKWYEWKKNTNLPVKQKKIIDYFEYAGRIIDEIDSIWMEGTSTMHPKPSPEKAIEMIDMDIAKFQSLIVPVECKTYHTAALKYLEIARRYQEGRMSSKENTDVLEKINLESLKYDGIIFSEFWKVMKNIGLMDNFENERLQLKDK